MDLLTILAQAEGGAAGGVTAIPAPMVNAAFGLANALVLAFIARVLVVRDRAAEQARQEVERQRGDEQERRKQWEQGVEACLRKIGEQQIAQDQALLRVEQGVKQMTDFVDPIREATRANLRRQFEHDAAPS